jgi:transglutaminase-like putative cysteine protease
MAHTQGTSARVQRLTSLVAVVLIALATGLAFGRVYLGHTATYQLIAVGIASGVVAWALERRSLVLATLVSAVLLVVAIGWLVFPESTWYGLPTFATLHDIAHAAGQVGRQARVQVSPAPATDALLFAGITAVWAALFSCHALAFRAGSPLLSLVPPLALVVFADSVLEEFVKPWYGVYFLVGGLAVVFADSLRRLQGWGAVWSVPGRRNRLLPVTGRSARRVGIFAVAVAIFAPVVVPGFGSKAVIDISQVNAGNGVKLAPLVSMAAQLQEGTAQPVFTVQTNHPSYWRIGSLDVYGTATSGTTWTYGNESTQPVSGTTLNAPAADAVTIDQRFTADNDWSFAEVPVAPNPTSVTMPTSALTWATASDTVRMDDPLHEGDTYTVVSDTPDPSRTELTNATIPTETPYTQLPGDMPARLHQIATQWTAGATTPYEQVLAIQRHLLAPQSGFTYNQYVRYTDDPRSLVHFLDDTRMGFCQQYASAMAVLLRELGIPARIAIGFTKGVQDQQDPSLWHVDTHNYHAWVEVLFNHWGWLGFEATPGISNPTTEAYQASVVTPQSDVICPPHQPRCLRPSVTASASPPASFTTRPGTRSSGEAGQGSSGSSWIPLLLILGLVLLVLVLSAIPLLVEARRRRRLRHAVDARAKILATYGVFADRAGRLGLPRGPGETADEYRARVQASGRLQDGHVDRLTRLAVLAAYSPGEPSADDALDARADADAALRELRDTATWRRRLLGMYLSPSAAPRARERRR